MASDTSARRPHLPDDRVRLIENTGWADDFSGREIEAFSRYVTALTVPKGHVIVREGGQEGFLCLIAAGRVYVSKKSRGNQSRLLSTAGPGKTFGEMSLIDQEPRSASVVAAEATTLVVLSRNDFRKLAEEVPRLAVKILLKIAKLTSQRLRQASGSLVEHL